MNVYAPPPSSPGPYERTTSPTLGYADGGHAVPRSVDSGYADNGYVPVGYAPPPPRMMTQPLAPTYRSPVPVQVLGFSTAAALACVALVLGLSAAGITRFLVSRERDLMQIQAFLASPEYTFLTLGVNLLVCVCGLLFASWLVVATLNARSWGTVTRRAPAWAFFAWFVPVVSLWFPKQMVDDVWRGSHPAVPAGTPVNLVPKPGLSTAWWAAYLLPGVLMNIGVWRAMQPIMTDLLAAMRRGDTAPPAVDLVQTLDTMAIWGLWAAVLSTAAALAAAALVVQVTLWQRNRLREMA